MPATNPTMASDPDPEPGPVVMGFDRTSTQTEDLDRWTEVARLTLVGERVEHGRLDLIFVDDDEMAGLNLQHMGHDGPTDVLSFPLDADDLASEGADFEGLSFPPDPDGREPEVHLGDVVVCPSVAADQAGGHCGTVDAELSLLVVHGVLHVLGHDHAEPEQTLTMQHRERRYLQQLGFEHPVKA